MAARGSFTCPICGREVVEVARRVAQDPSAQEKAARHMPEDTLSDARFCEDGNPPTATVASSR